MTINHDNWKTAWARGSKFEDIIWIGNDVLAWSSGLHIVFYEIEHKKKSILWCWSHDIGEGVRSLSSHTKYSIFAFAEKSSQPKIMVYTYPSLIKISECSNGSTNHCLCTGFTATDYIVSIDSYPHFRLSVWNWRTGEKIATVQTHIQDEIGQIMRINLIGPVLVAQVGKSCGEAYVWDLIITKETTILKEYEIKLPKDEPILGLDWSSTSTEPLLALVDKEGHIYLSNYDGSDVYRIMVGQRCNICIEKDLPIIKWFQDGLILRTPYCQISFYKKFARLNIWRKLWYVKTEKKPYLLITNPYRDRRFFYYTYEGELMQVDIVEEDEKPVVSKCFDNGGVYRFVDFVYPWCHHLFAICDANKEYVVLECYEGTLISNIIPDADDEILCQTSHPEFPLIVLATNHGELHCVSIVKPTNPKIVARLRLQRTPLDFIKFSLSGRSLIAAEMKTGDCYYINMQRVNMYDVQTLIRVGHPISDVLIFEGYKKLRILVLYTIVRNVGHSLFLYEILENQTLVIEPIVELLLPGVYRNLYHVPGNPMILVGTPYMTRQLRVQKIQDFKNITFEDGLMTGHFVKLASLFVDRWWIITMAIDGIVHVRDKTVRRELACIKTHHREELGTKKAMTNKQGDLIIALGYNGSLVATKFSPAKKERPESIITVRRDEIKAKPYISPSHMEMLMKQAAEEERIRKLLLADDFRERALMAMMNGVLEVRWEDIIKIDVPKPACMLTKKPEDYTSEDILAVKQYEKDVQFLKEERERYHRMLDAEYSKVMEQLKEGIDKFNGKLNNLFHMKMNVEAAINQLYLRYVRGLLLVHHRIITFEEENSLKERIASKMDYEREMDEHIKLFQNVHQKVSDKLAGLVSKEKAFAKKFKSEFYHMHKVQLEILERQCNRRPRVNLKNLESSDFYDLAEDVLGGKGARIYLPPECKDYLRILHNFDARPVTIPPSIDGSNWENLIRLRRAKINLELMIKGAQSELMDVETVLLGFEQKMEKCKIDMEDMKKDLVEKRMRQMMEDLDVEIQLVLKMGQVEIDLEGELTDSKHAVLVSKTTIDSANSYIRAAGECKLKALNNLLSFQRGTLLKQWQHMCRKKNLEDLKEDLRFTESTTVTKEMQGYLKRKAKGLPDDKTPQQLDDDIEAVKRKFQKVLDEETARLESVEKEIASLRVKNEQLDRQILEMNMARCDMELKRDVVAEERQKEHLERKVKMVMHRSTLVKKLQENYAELVELQTEHELLRLKRYPTFHFRMLDENEETQKNVRTNLC